MTRLVRIVIAAGVLAAMAGCVATDDYARAKIVKLEAKIDALEKQMDTPHKPDGRNPSPPGGGGALPPPPK